ncbi:hypothetical protein MAC_08686 [Metarhizium acridum CQMa 102]|uniref:Uncharacterized protein n=1 Tax=Metarhizium acridum (strain CQMa 102) TaxID=655827 RepID=E9EFN9_METAQ|nr:uncharacterized protein MAC_08686 [Metarhizium acridum CQMa 102]EFY85277.1 hypothetical protein MAC_08686 [Metarhizium acridum CQMa 102]
MPLATPSPSRSPQPIGRSSVYATTVYYYGDFADADACLWSRGKDPKTIGAYRVLNKDDYDAGIRALYQGNQMYNRYGLMIRLNEIRVSDDEDKEGTELIEQLSNSNEGRLRLPGESLDLAKREFTTAFVLEFSDEINQAIQEARSKLSVAWDQARDANVNQLANLSGWFRGKTEEKYYQTW